MTPEVVDGWMAELVAPAGPAAKPRLGGTSARLVRKVLSMALQEAVERGRLPRNPVVLTQPPRRDRSYRKQSWTLDEARRFLAGVREHRLYAAFHLGLLTGLRRGELLGLRWEDVDLDRRQLVVALARTAWRGTGLVFTTPLGGWIDPSNFSRTMDALVDQVGVPRITPRGLRHTAQSVGRVVVGDDTVMQERLGHADIGITLGT